MNDKSLNEYLTLQQTAYLITLSVIRVRQLLKDAKFRYTKQGNTILILKEDVDEYLRKKIKKEKLKKKLEHKICRCEDCEKIWEPCYKCLKRTIFYDPSYNKPVCADCCKKHGLRIAVPLFYDNMVLIIYPCNHEIKINKEDSCELKCKVCQRCERCKKDFLRTELNFEAEVNKLNKQSYDCFKCNHDEDGNLIDD